MSGWFGIKTACTEIHRVSPFFFQAMVVVSNRFG
jgi:hypothetical protein